VNSGTTLISGGTLRLGSASAYPSGVILQMAQGTTFDLNGNSATISNLQNSGTVTSSLITSSAVGGPLTLTCNSGGSYTFTGIIEDGNATAVSFNYAGGGYTLTLANHNTYTGTTTITSKYLKLGVDNALSSATRVVANGILLMNGRTQTINGLSGSGGGVEDAGTLIVDFGSRPGTDSDTISSTVGNNSALNLTKAGPGTLSFSGGLGFYSTGLLKITGGTLKLTCLQNASPITVYGGGTLDVNGSKFSISTLTLGDAGGTMGTVLNSSGTPQTMTLQGGTTALTVPAGAATGNVIQGTNLKLGLSSTTQTITVNGASDLTINAAIPNGQLTKAGTGTLILTGANTYNSSGGNTIINGGVLRANHGVGLPSTSPLTINGGVFETGANLARTGGSAAGNMQITGGTSGFSAYGADVQVAFGTLGSPTALTWGSGSFLPTTLVLNETTADHKVTFLNAINLGASTRTVNVNANVAEMSGALTGTGASGLTKDGPGKLVLSSAAASSYTGPTLIKAGMMIVNTNLSASSGVTVKSGATLGGTGTIAGSVSLDSGAHIAPGASVGTIHVGSLTLVSGNIADFEFKSSPASNDKIDVTTTNGLTLNGGTINLFDEAGGQWMGVNPVGSPYTLFTYAGTLGGAASNLSVGNPVGAQTYTFASGSGKVTLDITPEPATMALLGLGAVAMLFGRRRSRKS